MSPAFWNVVLSVPDDEFERIMDRLEAYERQEEARREQEQRERILNEIQQLIATNKKEEK